MIRSAAIIIGIIIGFLAGIVSAQLFNLLPFVS